jgi:hypothetical protein
MMITQDQIVEEFYNKYNNDLFYIPAEKKGKIDPTKPGKVIYNYSVKKQPITKAAFIEHLTTGSRVVTIGQLNKHNQCKWGVIDIDDYNPAFVDSVKQNIYLNKYPLNIVQSVSGGLHLYLYSQEPISGALMRNALAYYRDQLELKRNTEIYPKQSELTKKNPYGNMIKLPYPSGIDSKEIQTHLSKAKEHAKPISFFENLPKVIADEKNSEKKTIKETFTIKQIKQNIKNKVDHPRGGTFDNWITDLTAKLVAARKTDKQIATEIRTCWLYADKDPVGKFQNQDQDTYIENKVRNFRNKSNLEDPEILREKFIRNIYYVRTSSRYFNVELNNCYTKEAIETEFACIMEPKISPINYFKFHPDKTIVEDFLYRPNKYDPKEIIFELDSKKYINTYKPNNLLAIPGDISIFKEHLNYLFPIEFEKEHVLDFICYMIQNPGVKIRHALFIVSEEKQIGKGRLFHFWRKIFGHNNTTEIDINEALDKAKLFLDNQLVLIDELKSQDNWTENKKLVNFLKRIISEENHRNRELYVDFKEKHSTANFILHSNELNALSVDPQDPRYFVINCDVERRPDSYYEKLNEFIESDNGASYVLHFLQNRTISDSFSAKGAAPATAAKREMAKHNLHPFTQRVLEDYSTQVWPFNKDVVAASDVKIHYEKIDRVKINRNNIVSESLLAIGGVKLGQAAYEEMGQTTFPTLWVINNQDKYKNLSATEVIKQKLYSHAYNIDEFGKYSPNNRYPDPPFK